MPQRSIRFSETTSKQIRQAARQKGFTATAIIRHAVEQSLRGSDDGTEPCTAATLDQIRGDLSRVHRVQQTLFAFVDALAKAVLAGLPEQPPSSVARGKERYERFVKSASAAMLNNSHSSVRDEAES